MEQEEQALFQLVERLFKEEKYKDIIELLTDELLEKLNSAGLYAWKAMAHGKQKSHDLHLVNAEKSINSNPLLSAGYIARAEYFTERKHYEKAIEDYSIAIQINDADLHSYTKRGAIYFYLKEYEKAVTDFDKIIELDPLSSTGYNIRGLIKEQLKKTDEALVDFNRAIDLKEDDAANYYSRALHNKSAGAYEKAIDDFRKYVMLMHNKKNFFVKNAESEIEHLNKKLEKWYDEIDLIVEKIKELLLFDSAFLTHYTSLSNAKAMVFENSPLRLSEGAFLNDTSEGTELFEYLSFSIPKATNTKIEELPFVEKPFIGSFVDERKHNDLTLWRMYGKEDKNEAKGCALTISHKKFIDNLVTKLKLTNDTNKDAISPNESSFTFYKVAYKSSQNKFIISANDNDENNTQLNKSLKELINKLQLLNVEQKISVAKILNEIAYLFKGEEFQYEHEIRLVVEGIGFKKKITKEITPPKVYIELADIVPALHKITLGPKVERAEEWAAAFNYHIKETNNDVEIVISHLPFK